LYQTKTEICIETLLCKASSNFLLTWMDALLQSLTLFIVLIQCFCCSGTFRKCLRCSWNPMAQGSV